MCLNFEAEIAKKGSTFRSLYTIHFLTSDGSLFPKDPKFSLELKSILKERGIHLTEGAELESVDDFNKRIRLSIKNQTITKAYDAIFVDPAVEKSHLLDSIPPYVPENPVRAEKELLLFLGNENFFKLNFDSKGSFASAKKSNFLDVWGLNRSLSLKKNIADYPKLSAFVHNFTN